MAPLRLTYCCLIVFLLIALLSNAHNFHQASEVDDVAVAMKRTLGERKIAVVKQEMVASRCEKKGNRKNKKKKKKNMVGVDQARICKKNKVSEEGDGDKEFVAFNADYRAPRHHPPKNN